MGGLGQSGAERVQERPDPLQIVRASDPHRVEVAFALIEELSQAGHATVVDDFDSLRHIAIHICDVEAAAVDWKDGHLITK